MSIDEARLGRAGVWAQALLLLTLAVLAVVFAVQGRGVDLRVYLLAGERFFAGESLYRLADGTMPFKYLPPAAWFFAPLAWLPARLATGLVGLASVAATAWLVVRTTRHLVPISTPAERRAWAPVLALVALAQPLYWVLFYGQVDLLLAALVLAALFWAEEERAAKWLGAGFAGAVAVLLKPPALLLGLVWIAQRRWRALGAAVGWMVVLWLPFIGRYGFSGTGLALDEWRTVLGATTRPWISGYNSQGLPTLLLDLVAFTPEGPSALAIVMAQVASLTLAVAVIVVLRPPLRGLIASTVFLVCFLSPLAWRANFVLALPLLIVALTADDPRARRGAQLIAGLIAIAGVLVTHDVLGRDLEKTVLYARPFAWLFAALWVWTLSATRRRGAGA